MIDFISKGTTIDSSPQKPNTKKIAPRTRKGMHTHRGIRNKNRKDGFEKTETISIKLAVIITYMKC